jgi:site-specific recombinase XerD
MNKNQKRFTVELNDNQLHILDHYAVNRQPDCFVFPILNNHKDYNDPIYLRKRISSKNVVVNKWLKQIAAKVNERLKKNSSDIPFIESISFHVARHSFAQQAIENGLNMYELRQALRHSDIATTQKYLKGLDEQLADKAMKKAFKGWE